MSELRGLLFDFDGTIADTERFGHRVAYNRAFEELGLDWHWDENVYADLLAIAGGEERLRYYRDHYRPGAFEGADVAERLKTIHRAKVRYFDELAETIPLRPGVERLAREAQDAGVAVAIATTASQAGVEALLRHHVALRGAINFVAAGEAHEPKKPAPDVYIRALAELRLSAPDCVAIEDSNVGLRAALAAHVPTIVTVSDYTRHENFTGAAAVLSDLGSSDRPADTIVGESPRSGIVDLAYVRMVRARISVSL